MGQIIDIIIVFVCVLFAVKGFFRGFVSEVMSIFAFIGSFLITVRLGRVLIALISPKISMNPLITSVIIYALIFICSFILIKIVEVRLSALAESVLISSLNSIAGLIVGALKGALIIAGINFGLHAQHVFNLSPVLAESKLLPYIAAKFNALITILGI